MLGGRVLAGLSPRTWADDERGGVSGRCTCLPAPDGTGPIGPVTARLLASPGLHSAALALRTRSAMDDVRGAIDPVREDLHRVFDPLGFGLGQICPRCEEELSRTYCNER
jgi:hypothetical protein